ncbi:hypothetical protein [Corallococcus exercitus]|uniref:LuxR family transcriptional regulator n=1 Tax=Corallococcus exercitus TaxID=2316736 RepID=A0A7Y4JRE3_9BACT|nr:hypothetical protein [Corallococcus exercitus]NOK09483.1 hypothetical protein [Corallococcus exercitus]
MAFSGAVVTEVRREFAEDRGWYAAPYVEHYLRPSDLDESMDSCRWPERLGTVQGIGLFRVRGGRPFDAADRELLHLFHAECGSLLRPSLPTEKVVLEDTLTPRERQTLQLLLRGLGDKDIGDQSRSALLARLLGGEECVLRSRSRQ